MEPGKKLEMAFFSSFKQLLNKQRGATVVWEGFYDQITAPGCDSGF